jgi:hypothetical protein
MRKKIIPYLLVLSGFLLQAGFAQVKQKPDSTTGKPTANKSTFELLKKIPGNYIYLNVDVLDNIYLINNGNRLIKLNSNGDSVAVFNDVKKYGNPTLLDVSNPLKILLYYKPFSTVVILDRLLIMRNTINLRKQQIFSVQAIATSYDNNIWLFDEQDFKLKKVDEDGKLLQESTDMRSLVDTVPSPTQLIDNDNIVYLYDENKGFYLFDYYGALKNNLPFLHWQNPAIARNKMYGFTDNKLMSYELKSLDLKKYSLPDYFTGYLSIKAINGKVYLLKEDGLYIYQVQ